MAAIDGNKKPNVLSGGAESDVIHGFGGNDTLIGGLGYDYLSGDAGDDLIYADTGDYAEGGDGNDIFAVSGHDPYTIHGGSGYDILRPFGFDLTNTYITGIEQFNSDHSFLDAYQLGYFSLITGSNSRDDSGEVALTAGGRAEVHLSDTLRTFDVYGSDEADTLTFHAAETTSVYVDAGLEMDKITGSAGNDILLGGADEDRLNGGGGNDTLVGGDGKTDDHKADTLYGGGGDDWLYAGAKERAHGDAGNDVLVIDGGAPVLLDGGGDADILFLTGGDDITGAKLVGIEMLEAFGGHLTPEQLDTFDKVGWDYDGVASVNLTRGGVADVFLDADLPLFRLTGSGQADAITFDPATHVQLLVEAGRDNDMISGGSGVVDKLYGEAGNDTLQGGGGSNRLDGGEGNDAASYADSTGAVSVDLRITGNQNTLGAGRDTLISIESLIGSGLNDRLTGNDAQNTIEGGDDNDRIDGGAGGDTASYAGASAGVTVSLALTGGQNTGSAGIDVLSSIESLRGSGFGDALTGDDGANRLEGMAGRDRLTGGAGADILVGGEGLDRLDGGTGADLFVFNLASESAVGSSDTIVGFEGAGAAAGDRIDLSGIDALTAIDGKDAFTFNAHPSGWVRPGEISAVNSGTDTLIRGNTGEVHYDFALLIRDGATLASAYTAADFVL